MDKHTFSLTNSFLRAGIVLVAMTLSLLISSFVSIPGGNADGPQIKIFSENGEVNLTDGIPKDTEKLFLRMVPLKDDKLSYRISKAEVTLVTGGIGQHRTETGPTVELGPILAKASGKSALVIEIKECLSKNEQDQVEHVSNFTRFFNIPIK